MRRAPLLAVALAAAALAGCDQPLLSARVEIPEVRILEPAMDFRGAANIDPSVVCSALVALTGQSCSGVTASYDVGGQVPGFNEKGVGVDVRLTDVVLSLDPASTANLAGLSRLEVAIRDGSGGITRLASYVRPPGAAPKSIAVSAASNINLAPYLQNGQLDARVEVELDPMLLPTGFTASLEAGFSVAVTVDYKSFL